MSDQLRAIGQRWALQSDTTKEFQAEVASTAALTRIADALERIADVIAPDGRRDQVTEYHENADLDANLLRAKLSGGTP